MIRSAETFERTTFRCDDAECLVAEYRVGSTSELLNLPHHDFEHWMGVSNDYLTTSTNQRFSPQLLFGGDGDLVGALVSILFILGTSPSREITFFEKRAESFLEIIPRYKMSAEARLAGW